MFHFQFTLAVYRTHNADPDAFSSIDGSILFPFPRSASITTLLVYTAARSSFSAPRITILSPSSGSGRYSPFASSHGARIQASRSSSVVRSTSSLLMN
nr:hypothetical protein [Bradyrhizobium sp. Ash2021]